MVTQQMYDALAARVTSLEGLVKPGSPVPAPPSPPPSPPPVVAPGPVTVPVVTAPASAPVAAGITDLAFNCGGPAVGAYGADGGNIGGLKWNTSQPVDVSGISDSPPMECFQTFRYAAGTLAYNLSGLVPNTAYSLRLYFAEMGHWVAAERVMSVTASGATGTIDPFAAAKGSFKACVLTLSPTTDAGGTIALAIKAIGADPNAFVCAIRAVKA